MKERLSADKEFSWQVSEGILKTGSSAMTLRGAGLMGKARETFFEGDIGYAVSMALLSRIVILLLSLMFNHAFNIQNSSVEALCQWDCGWYMSIIDQGYDLQPHAHPDGNAANWAFFPLFPIGVKLFSFAFHARSLVSALIINNAFFILGLCVLFKYAKKYLDVRSARFVIAAFAFSPFSLFFSVPYTESFYFFFMVCALYSARMNKWILAGIFAAMLSGTRNLGVFVVFPLLEIALRQYGWKDLVRLKKGGDRATVALFIAPLGLFLYMFFLHRHMGDAFAFKNVQIAWGRNIGNPLQEIFGSLRKGNGYEKYCSLTAIFALIAGIYLYVNRFRAEAIIIFIGIMIPASTSIISMPRYALTLYPNFLALGIFASRFRSLSTPLLCCISAFLGFFVMSWITGKGFMP